jgi:hypothetical protein
MLRPMFRFSAPSPRAFRAPKDSTRADLLPVPDQLTARLTDRRTGRHIKSKDVLDESSLVDRFADDTSTAHAVVALLLPQPAFTMSPQMSLSSHSFCSSIHTPS